MFFCLFFCIVLHFFCRTNFSKKIYNDLYRFTFKHTFWIFSDLKQRNKT